MVEVAVTTMGATVTTAETTTAAEAGSTEDTTGETATVLRLTAATVSGMFSVAFRTDGGTTPHRPIAQ